MSRLPHDHGSLAVIGQAASIYRASLPHLARKGFFVFVCGAAKASPPKPPTLREQFLQVAPNFMSGSLCLLAESAASDVIDAGEPRFLNLALFERVIAEIADAIVLFTESPGSIAELGYFCAKPSLLSKLLVARDRSYENVESFINVGLIDQVNGQSIFRPVIHLDARGVPDFSPIFERIANRAKSALRMRPFEAGPFGKMSLRDKLIFLHFLINIMGEATYREIVDGIKVFCGDARGVKFDDVLPILCSTGLVTRDAYDPKRLIYNSKGKSFLEFKGQAYDEMRAVFVEAAQRKTHDVP
jgi:hypothetical protein